MAFLVACDIGGLTEYRVRRVVVKYAAISMHAIPFFVLCLRICGGECEGVGRIIVGMEQNRSSENKPIVSVPGQKLLHHMRSDCRVWMWAQVHHILVYGAVQAWVLGCMHGSEHGQAEGSVLGVGAVVCGGCCLVGAAQARVWSLHRVWWGSVWMARVIVVASMFAGFFVWGGVMPTVFFSVFGATWENAVYVPIAVFTVASFRLEWQVAGVVVQWLLLLAGLVTAAVRWGTDAGESSSGQLRGRPGAGKDVCKGFGGWEWPVYILLCMWPMLAVLRDIPRRKTTAQGSLHVWESAVVLKCVVLCVLLPVFVVLMAGNGDNAFVFAHLQAVENVAGGVPDSALSLLTVIGIAAVVETCACAQNTWTWVDLHADWLRSGADADGAEAEDAAVRARKFYFINVFEIVAGCVFVCIGMAAVLASERWGVVWAVTLLAAASLGGGVITLL